MNNSATFRSVRPSSDEYASYYARYIERIPDGDIAAELRRQHGEVMNFFQELGAERAKFRYAPEKWSMQGVLGHVLDAERIFSYRMLCIARGETNSLPGFDEDSYAATAKYDRYSFESMVEQFDLCRRALLLLSESLQEDDWLRRGRANDVDVTVRALAWMMAGHAAHHLGVLRERYLPAMSAASV